MKVADNIYNSWTTDASDADRIAMLPSLDPQELEQLQQLASPVWDGNLISKSRRDSLRNKGLIDRWNGMNFCTRDGYCVLDTLRMLGDTTKFCGGLPKKTG